ncbi:MAG TPA: Fic family protein [Chitinophagaceae bacterium]|nr:Fic family protein [Chitinophagaceae bacterium]
MKVICANEMTKLVKAAAVLQSIIMNHPFIDGSKRTGFPAVFVFLFRYVFKMTATNDGAYNFVIGIASSRISFEESLHGCSNIQHLHHNHNL